MGQKLNNMKKDNLSGGKADKMSIKDIAKKHKISTEKIEAQIEMGKKVEMEHVKDVNLAKEIAMDHLEEIPDYYTRLKDMEKKAKKELSLEARRFIALSGVKEDEFKKFLTNEAFQQAVNEKTDEEESDDNFIILEFEQEDVPPGEDDELYKIKMKKDD